MLINKKRLVGCLFCLFLLLRTHYVFAETTKRPTATPTPFHVTELPQSGINLSLSPTFINLVADPGKEVDSAFKLKNNNNFTEYLSVTLAKFSQVNGEPTIEKFSSKDTYAQWVAFDEPQFSVAPNETKIVKFHITPPQDASLGYYYAFIINRIKERENSSTEGATITGSPALLTLLEVRSPNAKRELSVTDFSTDAFIYENLPVTFTVKVKNTGNVHIVPKGNIFLDQGRKKDIAILLANEARGNVLPGTEREFTSQWNDGFAVRVPKMADGKAVKDAKGNAEYTLTYDFTKANKFRIGKYTANLLLVYDNGERDVPVEAHVSFWVFPWKIAGGVLFVLLLAVFGLKSIITAMIRGIRGSH